jgi:ubiquinone/menaquinone biosynthesis C-methylase UbiE
LADGDPSLARRARSPARSAPSDVAQYFGRLAHSYGDGEYYIRRRAAVVIAIADEIAGARRVLDLGCGNGRYLYEFRKSTPEAPSTTVVGADLSAEMIAQARLRNGAGTPLLRADATAVPIRDGALDLIFASHVFQFVSDKDATMRGLARCLLPGGAIIVTVGGSGIRAALRGFASEEQWSELAGAAFPSRRRIVAMEGEEPHRKAMSRAGLAIEIRDARFTVTWAGIVEWIDLRWSPFMDDEQRATATRILDEMAQQLSPRSFDLSERLLVGRKPAR